jgi:hypothetical protein
MHVRTHIPIDSRFFLSGQLFVCLALLLEYLDVKNIREDKIEIDSLKTHAVDTEH